MGVGGRQLPLFARKALAEYPQQTASADLLGEADADDNHRYYIKGDAHGRFVRASEWLCTHIAEEVHIGAPAPMAIERLDGMLVFGSRRIVGVSDIVTTAAFLTTPTLSNSGSLATGLQPILSSIYVLDLFLNNEDRHLGNFLSIDDNGVRRLYAFDFSRALFWNWPWTGFPLPGQNTRVIGGLLRQMHGFDLMVANATLDRLAALASDTVESFINRMPSDWLPEGICSDFVSWWSNGQRQLRVEALRKGISDGTLL